jgi:hypothetical protein
VLGELLVLEWSARRMSMRRAVVIVPVATHTAIECERGLVELEKRGYVVWRRPCHVSIDLGRSQMASEALGEGFEELMWIDADIGFSADDVDRLRAHSESFVCGIYAKRGLAELACHTLPETKELVFGEMGGITPLLYAGMGFALVRREVLDDIRREHALPTCGLRTKKPFAPYFLPLVVGDWYLPEDFAFCERARTAGHPVFADTRIRLTHVGRYGYSWEDAAGARQRFDNVKMLLR